MSGRCNERRLVKQMEIPQWDFRIFICQRDRCNDLIDVAGASNFQMEMRHLEEKYDLGNAFRESVRKEMFVRVMS